MVFWLSALYQIYSPLELVQSKIIVAVVVQSVIKLCSTLCDPKDCSTPGFPGLHCLPEFTQTHVYWVTDTIEPSHSLAHSSSAFNLSQNQSLFQWVSSLHQVAKVLEVQHQFFQWIFRVDLQLTGLISLLSKELSGVFSSITIRKHHFFGAWPSIGPILFFFSLFYFFFNL